MSWLDDFVVQAHRRLLDLPSTAEPRAYLLSRGVQPQHLDRYRLGWVENPSTPTCTPEFWTWAKQYAWDKICFPLTDPFGTVIGIQLRSPHERGYRDFLLVPGEVCPPTFGLAVGLPAAFQSQRLVLVEGVFDYFAVVAHTPDVIAILTSSASLAIRRMLSRYVGMVVCLTDMDAPGRRGAYRLAGLPIPPQYQRPKDKGTRTLVPPYQVLIPAYSEHDPSDLIKAGKFSELRRLANLGLLSNYPRS